MQPESPRKGWRRRGQVGRERGESQAAGLMGQGPKQFLKPWENDSLPQSSVLGYDGGTVR